MSSNFKPWLLLVGIFIIGVVTGWALTFGLASHFMPPPGAHNVKQHWMARLTRDLNLTADQQAKIQPILTDAETKLQALHRESVGRGDQIFKAADDQILPILTDAQKAQLQKMQSEREKMFSGHMRPWGAHHDGPDDAGPPPPPAPPNAVPEESAPQKP